MAELSKTNIPNLKFEENSDMSYIVINDKPINFCKGLKNVKVKSYYFLKEPTKVKISDPVVRKGDIIVVIEYNNDKIVIKHNMIKGDYLLSMFPSIGIIFSVDVNKDIRAEIINMYIIDLAHRNLSLIEDKKLWDALNELKEDNKND